MKEDLKKIERQNLMYLAYYGKEIKKRPTIEKVKS